MSNIIRIFIVTEGRPVLRDLDLHDLKGQAVYDIDLVNGFLEV